MYILFLVSSFACSVAMLVILFHYRSKWLDAEAEADNYFGKWSDLREKHRALVSKCYVHDEKGRISRYKGS